MIREYLVIGASGFIGSRLYARLGPDRAIGTYHRTPVPFGVHFDLGGMRLDETVLAPGHRITHAFLLSGIGSLDACARDPEGTAAINVEGMCRAIDQLAAAGIKIIFTSSDAVFDGSRGGWTEDEPAHPVMTYGMHKAAVERYLAASGTPHIIARLSKVVGIGDDHSLFGEWIRKLLAGEPIYCARDMIFSPISVEDCVTSLLTLAEGPYQGMYNVCGPRGMNRLELLEMFVAEVRRYRDINPRIVPCSIRDFPFPEPRPLIQSMSCAKLSAVLPQPLETMESCCRRVAEQCFAQPAAAERGQRLRGAN